MRKLGDGRGGEKKYCKGKNIIAVIGMEIRTEDRKTEGVHTV